MVALIGILIQLEMDYTYSPEHNFTYVVQWDRQRTIEPGNVDDEELVGFGPVTSHPLTRHTVSLVGAALSTRAKRCHVTLRA